MTQEKVTKFGYLALMGSPNAGKSTLLNSCLGQKIAGVSAKPQTTRNRIIGIVLRSGTQIALLDTPGLHRIVKSQVAGPGVKPTQKLSQFMNREAWGAARDADTICYLIDISRGPCSEDAVALTSLFETYKEKLIIVLSKADKIQKSERLVAEEHARDFLQTTFGASVPLLVVSAKQKESVDQFLEYLALKMPEGVHHYPLDTVTDRSPEFVCSELIREQLFRQLGQELPYSTAVKVDELVEGPRVQHLMATIFVPKVAHKGIVIGKGGQKLKEIGSAARIAIEKYLGDKVFLELFVKVQENWFEREGLINELLGPSYSDDESVIDGAKQASSLL